MEIRNKTIHQLLKETYGNPRTFASGEEMLETLISGRDFYCPNNQQYVYVLNNLGSIHSYDFDEDEVEQIIADQREIDEYWGGLVPGGGSCHDGIGYENNEFSLKGNNLDWCNEHFADGEWYDVTQPQYLDLSIIRIYTEDDTKMIGFLGYGYTEGEDNGGGEYRFVSYGEYCAPLSEVLKVGISDYETQHCDNVDTAIEDCDSERMNEIYENCGDGDRPPIINEYEITGETPDGCYLIKYGFN